MKSRRLGRHEQLLKAGKNAPVLLQGSNGPGVAELQSLLADLGFTLRVSLRKGRPDGIYGPETERAVKEFQRRNRLKPDGVVGRNTIAVLDSIVTSHPMLEVTSNELERQAQLRDASTPISRCRSADW